MIVDANIVVSAVLGRSRSLFYEVQARGIDIIAPAHQFREAHLVGATEATRRGLDPTGLMDWISDVVLPIDADFYAPFESAARARLQPAGQKDWPLIALAMATGEAIWSHDNHLFGSGVAVWSTLNIKFARPHLPSQV